MTQFASRKGHMTLPVEEGQEDVVLDLYQRWQADALRDSDGTTMPDSLAEQDSDIYSVMCLVRADQAYANQHPEYLHRKYLMSFPVTAMNDRVAIFPLDGYSKDKYELDDDSDPKQWWEVRNRTLNIVIPTDKWSFDAQYQRIDIEDAIPYHEYTITFMARQVWDSVSMYNALTNDWKGPRIKSLDPYHPECRTHLLQHFAHWLETHPNTTVVRFTTFAFLFVIDTGEKNQDIYRDWTGYGETVSPRALEDFEQRFGYKLSPEDFVDAGYYNGTYKVPSQQYRDWMTFVQDFVVEFAAELVSMAHQAGKKTAMFQGDHWIGTEPFLESYQKIGIDINVGAVEDGVALRRLTDSGGDQIREARFYPYFFPDVFREGNDPVVESMSNWTKIRRAMLQKPLDRIGYGGYLSLANQFPHFIDHVTDISRQFGEYLDNTQRSESKKMPGKVAVLSAWGTARSWLQNQARDQRFYVPPRPDVMELVGNNLLECLSGLPFEVEFISFDDIAEKGIDPDIKVIINTGDANSAWSGGECWDDHNVIVRLRQFVAEGGGLLGVSDPSAWQKNGRYFQLGDVFGLEKETSLTMGRVAMPLQIEKQHYLSQFIQGDEDFGNPSYVYPQAQDLTVLAAQGQHLALTARGYGSGRAVYLGNLPFSMENARLLQHILLWLTQQEETAHAWLSNNPYVDVAFYPQTNKATAVNFTDATQQVTVLNTDGEPQPITLKPYEWCWFDN
ncbi:1,3-beta-galactosyl-N-acetylhexosamine phosphorylase [Vibrio vulnificus]|uniref:1,3-beta-galactosyl-N-acetylhexosamine phosphorylase n=1 Tax=Vibrio vulnificus TaxID=672 RepID=UPI000CD176DC|nr:1,3-beta-galactosyl-N-acetylhexosamine phosphorylase [Vibrio vulnificus]EHD1695368.1 1,3-beta-galactosyl-N-acetylhexosamine phosphorylase [Vibrio vulnificus]EHU4976078.1 1,3-beta-galactosyl-N-acetylhexosamine phosphorylase [Vibrio vulnificus]MCU8446879.1 1,3-beta-galactosyl-N-acetylhexosamine phosphorylase [Vibrio vulnificus]POC39456.1 1,3-beta-galactosyl-N-acetylhexosamine phosphorylase [Vibrio vulnificus]POC56994.1 1,3-beta-galactosyl-N-acetylhexosamine phosphorylase [Vibrio vulnificus]